MQRYGVRSAVCGTVHYDSIRVGHSPDFGLPSVVILPFFAESEVDNHSLIKKMI